MAGDGPDIIDLRQAVDAAVLQEFTAVRAEHEALLRYNARVDA